jgi:hypothetical protein
MLFCHTPDMRPPATQETLDRVESLAGVRLPEDYREFVTTVGDGAPGPYGGITSLADALTQIEVSWGPAVLGRDNPLTTDVDFGEILGKPADWDDHEARLDDDLEYAAGWEELQAEYIFEPWCQGRLPIADYGCGDWFFLILRGPRRGTVWVDSVVGATGLYCLEVDFKTWYSRWLDYALDRASRGDDYIPARATYSYLEFGDNPRYRIVGSGT